MTSRARVTIDADVTPQFTACYLRITGEQCAFVEAHTRHALPRLLAALAEQGKRAEDVRWVVVTHAHLDHAAGASALMHACPNATLLAHPRAAKNLIDPTRLVASATAVYGKARFEKLYGAIEPIAAARVRALEDGEGFELGGDSFTVHHTRGHANHHFIVHDAAMDTVFTGDAFGLVYPALQTHGLFALPSTSPTQFDAAEAKKSLDIVLGRGSSRVCPTHFGEQTQLREIANQVGRFVERAGAWVEASIVSSEDAAALETRFAKAWRDAIAEEAPAFGERERALLGLDVELNARGLVSAVLARREKKPAATA